MTSLALSPRRLLRSRWALACFLILPIILLHYGMTGPGGFKLSIPLLPQPDPPVTNNNRRPISHKHGSWKWDHGHTQGPRDHKYNLNGILDPNPKGQHPIYDLLERAQHEWDTKLDKASKTLAEAVNEYRRRYNRAPPRGFDRWWSWAKSNNVQLPDEYDQIVSVWGTVAHC